MEEIIDFDNWIETFQLPTIEYVAVFDPFTGDVTSVGPSYAFTNSEYTISIDTETAEKIISAEIKIHNCQVDINSNKFEIAETKSLTTIDDVLHRISLIEHLEIDIPDVHLTYNLKNKTLRIQLSEALGGTKKIKQNFKPRKIVWDSNAEMNFLITEYNDPNLIFEMFSVKISELIGKTKIIKDINYDKFSVYTRRLFKNYVIEYI